MEAAKTLTGRVNGPPRLTGRGLIIVCSHRGGNGNAEPRAFQTPFFWRIVNAVTPLQLRRFVAAMRDHFANPRDFAYQQADALGLTWSRQEQSALHQTANVFVNGRRLFAWNREIARSLPLRRILANKSFVELVWGVLTRRAMSTPVVKALAGRSGWSLGMTGEKPSW